MELQYTHFCAYNSTMISQFIHPICSVFPKMSKELVTIWTCNKGTFTEVVLFSWTTHLSWELYHTWSIHSQWKFQSPYVPCNSAYLISQEILEKNLTLTSMKASHLLKLFLDIQQSSCFEISLFEYRPSDLANTVEPSYNNIGLCNNSSTQSDILWYQLIPLCHS